MRNVERALYALSIVAVIGVACIMIGLVGMLANTAAEIDRYGPLAGGIAGLAESAAAENSPATEEDLPKPHHEEQRDLSGAELQRDACPPGWGPDGGPCIPPH